LITNYRVIKFLIRRTYESTDDVDIIRLCRGLRYILFIYAVALLGCLILLFDKLG